MLAALDMVAGVETQALPPARVGIQAGPVVFQDGDHFGWTVNVAARIAEYARPGEVVVTQDVVDVVDGTEIAFTEIGDVELKGVLATLRLHGPSGPLTHHEDCAYIIGALQRADDGWLRATTAQRMLIGLGVFLVAETGLLFLTGNREAGKERARRSCSP